VYILDNVKTSLTMTTTDYIGAIGVSLILLAFFLNLRKVVDTQNMLYLALNFVGAGLACSASMMMQYVPFIVLEGTWMMMTGFALLRRYAQWRVQVRNTLQGQLA
jgi:hypothetical protein